jgi:CO/xanthine dehydrogenase FAD-binding subunit
MLALDAKVIVTSDQSSVIGLGEFLPLRLENLRGKLITLIEIPINTNLAFEYVARTPADKPIVCVALATWPSGRTRLALGGFGKSPLLAMDGTESEGFEAAARNAFHEATDEWASAEYRMDVAATLAKRCFENLNNIP